MADYDIQYQDTYIDALLATANELKTAGYIYKGVATPSTNPGTPTERVAYLASEPGTYTNFGGIVITSGLYSLTYASGTWTGTQMSAGSDIEVVQTTGDSTTDVMSQKAVTDLFIKENQIDISNYPSCGGYIDTTIFKLSSAYYGILIPFSQYRGKIVRFKKTTNMIRYAFTTGTLQNYVAVPFCSGESQKTYTTQQVDVVVPNDCNYLYIYVYSNGTNVRPTLYELETVSFVELAQNVGALNEKVGSEMLDVIELQHVQGSDIVAGRGYVDTNGTFHTSSTYYGGFINIGDYRGKRVKITPRQNALIRYAFCTSAPTTTTSTSILCDGCLLIQSNSYKDELIPNDCNYLYVYLYANGANFRPESVVIHEETTITSLLNYVYEKIEGEEPSTEGDEMDMGEYTPSVAEIFNYNFINLTAEQEASLLGLSSATIAEDGLSLPSLSKITHNKIAVFDDEKIMLDITATTSDKVLMYASTDGSLSTSQVESYILFDFINGRVSIYQAQTINTSTGLGTELCGVNFTASNGDYLLTIGRHRRNVFASIYSKSTRVKAEITATETLYPSVNSAKRPAGWMYKKPSFMTIAGTPIYKRFSCNVKGSLFMMFQGDSYTEGYAGFYPNCWAYKAARYFKNSRTCGLSGHKLADMITQYHDSIKGKINISVMVISIGINDMSDLTTDAKIATWANTYKGYLDELVEDGIIPIVNRIWPEGSNDSATSTKAKKMNDYIRSWGFDGADFGAVNGYTSNSTYYTDGHLTVAGNDLTYQIFINELSKYKNN